MDSSPLSHQGNLLAHSCSVTKSCPPLCDPMDCSRPCSLSFKAPGICWNSLPLSWWCYLTILSSAARFSFCHLSFPATGSFPMSQLFPSGWPKYWSFSISPSNEYLGLISFRIDWFDLMSLKSILVHGVAPYRESPCPRSLLKRLHWRELFRAVVLTQVSINTPPQGAGRKPATQIHFLSLSLASPFLLRMGIFFASLHPKS